MRVADYLRDVLVPANVAVSALQRAGLPIDLDRLRATKSEWLAEIARLEAEVEAYSETLGTPLKYSAKHNIHPPKIAAFLVKHLEKAGKLPNGYVGPDGKKLVTPKGGVASDAKALKTWASLRVPKPDDDEWVTKVLQIRSLSKGVGTYLDSLERTVRVDGACHPKYSWALRTSRLSAEDPPVHQIPERSEKRVPDGVKRCIVPRVSPARDLDEWDPRKHGSCWRWDIAGAEAAWRAAALTYLAEVRYPELGGVRDPIAYDYIRLGKDIHSKTASLVYNVPEGTYRKGTYERDAVGKNVLFAKVFGAKPTAVQYSIWDKARIWLPSETVRQMCDFFDQGYLGLAALYEIDKILLGRNMDADGLSYVDDPYGRRRAIQVPPQIVNRFRDDEWLIGDIDNPWSDLEYGEQPTSEVLRVRKEMNHAFHIAANTPTQSANASDTLWMIALHHFGEYVELRVPPMLEKYGVPFPEARGWQMNEGDGPGGKPMLSWYCNTVHDSGWGDCAPGYLEPTAKLIWRRCTALPQDWRIEADVPYRIELKVGPNMGDLMDYNKAAKKFGLEPLVER